MNEIAKTWNAYRRHDGYVMGWEREEAPGAGHRVTVMDDEETPVTFRWRGGHEPVAGARTSVVMVARGVSLRPERPVLVLDHDGGAVMREQNAPPARGSRPIMIGLGVWMAVALAISLALLMHVQGPAFAIITLLSAAFLTWRLAIATAELRMDERARVRIAEEEKLCLEIVTGEWRLRAGERIELKRRRAE